MPATTAETFAIRRTYAGVITRWPCVLCGDGDDKTGYPYGYVDEDGDDHTVCDGCAAATPAERQRRISVQADALTARAERLRVLSNVPFTVTLSRDPEHQDCRSDADPAVGACLCAVPR